MHDHNAFLTLTYNDEHLPEDGSIHKEELQRFFKRLRKEIYPTKVRYFACGEYGEKKARPHYHVILFGYDFRSDRYKAKVTQTGNTLWRSPTLEKVWYQGYSYIGEVTFESAAYVARYVMKKWKKDPREKETEINLANSYIDRETGEVFPVEPEFVLMSRGRKPDGGIGKTWYDKYAGDTEKDFIYVNGKRISLPKYYDTLLAQTEGGEEELLKRKGRRIAAIDPGERTYERIVAKEKVKKRQIGMLNRSIENES